MDFSENDGVATQLSATTFRLEMTVNNNMDTEPAGNPYNDYVSEIRIDGIHSASEPGFGSLPTGWVKGLVLLTNTARGLWTIEAHTNINFNRIAPGSSRTFNITLPPGIPASRVRYGAVAAQGGTFSHGYEPDIPDTFVGVVGIEEGEGVRVSGVAGGEVLLELRGLEVGREYVLEAGDSPGGWTEVLRFTAQGPPDPETGRAARTWSEAVPPGRRRFYRLRWIEP